MRIPPPAPIDREVRNEVGSCAGAEDDDEDEAKGRTGT